VNAKTGRKEYVVVNLVDVYPDGDYKSGREYCLEEIRAHRRGLLNRDWRKGCKPLTKRGETTDLTEPQPQPLPQIDVLLPESQKDATPDPIHKDHEDSGRPARISIFADAAPAEQKQTDPYRSAKKSRREDRANRTQKIQILEVRAEPQTGKLMLTSVDFECPQLNSRSPNKPCLSTRTKIKAEEVCRAYNDLAYKGGHG
jgi:checkpoint serine/threonine-protein kinase